MECTKENTNMSLPITYSEAVKRNKKVNKKTEQIAVAPIESANSPDPFKQQQQQQQYTDWFTQDKEFEPFLYPLKREDKWSNHFMISTATRASLCCWLMKLHGVGGNPAVIHTAIWYLDSILAMGIGVIDLHLYATACFWIAQKLHGRAKTAQELVKRSNYAFTTRCLLRAETFILIEMKFPAKPVQPQEFITFLSRWCDCENPGEIELAASFICMSGLILDRGCLGAYPSAMGAVAVWNALYLSRKSNLLRKLEECPLFKVIEKKSNFHKMFTVQRDAVLKYASPIYEYRAPLEIFSSGPSNVPEKIVQEVILLSNI